MFKPELWQSHDEYRTLVTTVGRRLSCNNPRYFFNEYDEERQKLLNLNLDPLLEYIPRFYSSGGRPAKHQAQILSPSQINFPGCPYWLYLSGRTSAAWFLL